METEINSVTEQEMDPARFAQICRALGHPARVAIVSHLKRIDQCVCGQIVGILPLAQSTVSQHLKTLRAAGLIRGRIDGPRTCYCIDHEALAAFRQMVDIFCQGVATKD